MSGAVEVGAGDAEGQDGASVGCGEDEDEADGVETYCGGPFVVDGESADGFACD